MRQTSAWALLSLAVTCLASTVKFAPENRTRIVQIYQSPAYNTSQYLTGGPRNASGRRCYAKTFHTRACHFYNLVYDKEAQQFLYFTGGLRDKLPRLKVNHPTYVKLGMEADPNVPEQTFRISWFEEPLYEFPGMCVTERPVYLHHPCGGDRYGHVFRDNLHAIVHNLLYLDVIDRDFRLLTVGRAPAVFTKYATYVATEVDHWASELARCGARHVLFRELFAGHGTMDMRPRARQSVNVTTFRAQRAQALRLAAVPDRAARDLRVVRVVFNDKAEDDNRRVLNVPEVVRALRARFPDVVVESHVFPRLRADEQLRILGETSVFVSNVGSASFRLVYLPVGAHVIIVGAPEFGPPDLAAYSRDQAPIVPWGEVDHYWVKLDYLRVSKYFVTEAAEAVFPATDRFGKTGDERHPWFTYWDANTVLNATKLGDLVAEAVESLKSADR